MFGSLVRVPLEQDDDTQEYFEALEEPDERLGLRCPFLFEPWSCLTLAIPVTVELDATVGLELGEVSMPACTCGLGWLIVVPWLFTHVNCDVLRTEGFVCTLSAVESDLNMWLNAELELARGGVVSRVEEKSLTAVALITVLLAEMVLVK